MIIKDLSQKIQTTVQPVFVSQKIGRDLKLREAKPPIVNQQYLVYKFECDLCDAGYVGGIRSFRLRVVSPTVCSLTSRDDSPTSRFDSPTPDMSVRLRLKLCSSAFLKDPENSNQKAFKMK